MMCRTQIARSCTDLLPFSSSALAEYICADRSAMMRELASMKRDGIVNSERRKNYDFEILKNNLNAGQYIFCPAFDFFI